MSYVCDGRIEHHREISCKQGQQDVARNIFCLDSDGDRAMILVTNSRVGTKPLQRLTIIDAVTLERNSRHAEAICPLAGPSNATTVFVIQSLRRAGRFGDAVDSLLEMQGQIAISSEL